MESNNNKGNFVDVPQINSIIEKLGEENTIITSAILHPVHEYNAETGEFEFKRFTYDVDIQSDKTINEVMEIFKKLNKYTGMEFIYSSVNGNPVHEKD